MPDNEKRLSELPVYPHTGSYAREHNELPQYRESNLSLIACRNAIDVAIRNHFDGMHLDSAAARSVLEEYGAERTFFVLANTVQQKAWDGRFSAANKAWAQSIAIPEDVVNGFDRRTQYISQSHPAVLNGYIDMARREAQQLEGKGKPSVRDQIATARKSSAKQVSHPRKHGANVR